MKVSVGSRKSRTRPGLRASARLELLPVYLDVPTVLLLAENLTVERGGRAILSELSFRAESGEAVLLTGPNGAGKTTLLRTLAGYIRPLSGRVELVGGDASRTLPEQCHFVGHLNAVKPSFSAVENLEFCRHYSASPVGRVEAVFHGRDPTTSPEPAASGLACAGLYPTYGQGLSPTAALDRLGLGDLADVPAGYLSAGQRRRLALARLLVTYRPVWLLDEPTVSLDAASVTLFAGLVAEHLAQGGLVVAATHVPLGIADARELQLGRQAEAA